MKISLGFSPCPNDTFIFDALVHQRVDTEGLEFDVVLADVEQLNQWAFEGKLDATKLSYHALAYCLDRYALLPSGSALGRGCGPLLIAKNADVLERVNQASIAIPGRYTTAYFLLRCAFPGLQQVQPMLFSAIEDAVANEQVDAGLIIHENRFTYMQKGLVKLIDLGEWWEQTTGFPIPLGGIVVNRRLDVATQQKIQRALHRSIAFAFQNREAVMPYVRAHAQAMDDAVMAQHIALYVNDFTLELGSEGRAAIEHLLRSAHQQGLTPPPPASIFIE